MAVVKAISNQELAALANRLRLTLIRDRMEEMLTMAVDKKLSPRETLEFFFRQEIRRREENRIRQGIMGAHFPAVRTLEDFDFEAQPSIDAKQIKELAQLEWTHNKNNRCNGYFLHVVKAIKWWHKSQHPEQDHPNSYPLEHFIGECCPDYIESVAEGVVKTFETMLQYNEKPNLSDRGVPEHDVFGRVTEAEYQSFYNAVNKAALLARKAYDSTRIEESASLWCQLFGSEFPTPPKKQVSFTNRTEPTTTVPRGNFA